MAVEGASAAGKTTAVATVARRSNWTVLREAYRRIDPPLSLEFRTPEELLAIELRLLREEARRFGEARGAARAGRTVLADTGFLGPLTYTAALVAASEAPPDVLSALVELARELGAHGRWGLADAYVYLDTPPSVRSTRAREDPAGHPVALDERHARVGGAEREFYRRRFAPIIGARFRSVPGEGRPEEVAGRVADAVRAMAGTPSSVGSIASALALFEAGAGARNPEFGNR
ncbi:MAG: AAA family ATPase [Thermoplasmata archaeon]